MLFECCTLKPGPRLDRNAQKTRRGIIIGDVESGCRANVWPLGPQLSSKCPGGYRHGMHEHTLFAGRSPAFERGRD